MTSGLTTATATSALSRETPTKETPETAEMHVEKRLKRLWVRIGETLKRLRSTNAGRWWLVWVSGARKWVLGSSKAVKVACLAVFDPSTNSALSRQPECVKKYHIGLYDPPSLIYNVRCAACGERACASPRRSPPRTRSRPSTPRGLHAPCKERWYQPRIKDGISLECQESTLGVLACARHPTEALGPGPEATPIGAHPIASRSTTCRRLSLVNRNSCDV